MPTPSKGEREKKYRILFDWGTDGMKFQDEKFSTVAEAVKHAVDLNYGTKFFIVQIIDWEAIQKCPYPDCPQVKYYDCPIHGKPHA